MNGVEICVFQTDVRIVVCVCVCVCVCGVVWCGGGVWCVVCGVWCGCVLVCVCVCICVCVFVCFKYVPKIGAGIFAFFCV